MKKILCIDDKEEILPCDIAVIQIVPEHEAFPNSSVPARDFDDVVNWSSLVSEFPGKMETLWLRIREPSKSVASA